MSMLDTLLDPERRAKAKEDQEKLKKVWGHRLAKSPAHANFLHGMAREQMALDQLGVNQNPDDAKILMSRLAEGLAMQGKFSDTVELEQDPERKTHYQAQLRAVENVGEQQCEHPIAKQHKSESIWNGKVLILFTRCYVCGAISAYA